MGVVRSKFYRLPTNEAIFNERFNVTFIMNYSNFNVMVLTKENIYYSMLKHFLQLRSFRMKTLPCAWKRSNKLDHYKFTVLLGFWLAKIPSIIHHNQLLSTKCGRILRYVKNDVSRAAKLPDYWTVHRGDLGTRLSCFGSAFKMAEHFTGFTRKIP